MISSVEYLSGVYGLVLHFQVTAEVVSCAFGFMICPCESILVFSSWFQCPSRLLLLLFKKSTLWWNHQDHIIGTPLCLGLHGGLCPGIKLTIYHPILILIVRVPFKANEKKARYSSWNWYCFWSMNPSGYFIIWNDISFCNRRQIRLRQKRQLLKNKVIWFFGFCFTLTINEQTGDSENWIPGGELPAFRSLLTCAATQTATGQRAATALCILWKHFQSCRFGMKVQVQLSIEKGTATICLNSSVACHYV